MVETVFKVESSGFHWIDVVNPTREELEILARQYGLHPTSVQDCLDPEHLPKYERIGALIFLILRAYDEACTSQSDTVQELTRKVAFFLTDQCLITIHRKDQVFFQLIRERWRKPQTGDSKDIQNQILTDLISGVLTTFERPIDRALVQLEEFEMRIFGAQGAPFSIQDGYYLKRQAFVFKRMIRSATEIFSKVNQGLGASAPVWQDLKEHSEGLYFYSEEILESINSLLNLHISLSSQKTNEASHRTNEIVRVLTVFSVFFMPLNFIASIYGMNFEHIPELKWVWGYPMVISMMAAIALSIYLWFRIKGWLK